MSQQNIVEFILIFLFSIWYIIPFIVVDIYYSYNPYDYCLDYSFNINTRIWLMVNGYMSIFSVLFIFITSLMIYTKNCVYISSLIEHPYFIKTYIYSKISFSFIWNIMGIILLSYVYDYCSIGKKIYIITRISFVFIFIGLSIKNIKEYEIY
jgi:hypothetical protein